MSVNGASRILIGDPRLFQKPYRSKCKIIINHTSFYKYCFKLLLKSSSSLKITPRKPNQGCQATAQMSMEFIVLFDQPFQIIDI